jgi:hypothetical protein
MVDERRRHRVRPRHEIRSVEHATVDVRLANVPRWILRARTVERNEPALRRHQECLAVDGRVRDRVADHALAALAAVVPGGVDDADPVLDRVDDRVVVGVVHGVGRLAEVRSESDARDDAVAEPPEVRPTERVRETVAVVPRRRRRNHARA